MQGIMVACEYSLYHSVYQHSKNFFIIKLQNKIQNVAPDDSCPKATAKTYIDLSEGTEYKPSPQ